LNPIGGGRFGKSGGGWVGFSIIFDILEDVDSVLLSIYLIINLNINLNLIKIINLLTRTEFAFIIIK
jgi:hypothetical protein